MEKCSFNVSNACNLKQKSCHFSCEKIHANVENLRQYKILEGLCLLLGHFALLKLESLYERLFSYSYSSLHLGIYLEEETEHKIEAQMKRRIRIQTQMFI